MSGEQTPPYLVDAVRASASKMQGMKSALDARARELDGLKAQLDSERRELEKRAALLEAEQQSIEREGEEVRGTRLSLDRDLASMREDRERLSAEQSRLQELANDLAERKRVLSEAESYRERLDQDIIRRMRESEAKFLAIVDREGELVKQQHEWLVAFEQREEELRTIKEHLHAQQKESVELHKSLAHIETLFKDETDRLAAQRRELAVKEESLREAQGYLATIIETSDSGPRDKEQPIPVAEYEPPTPAEPPQPSSPVAPLRPEPVEPEEARESEAEPAVTKTEALDLLTRTIEAWKRAREGGKDVGDMRSRLKLAKDALQAGKYDTAIRLATEVLEELHAAVIAR